MKNTLKTLGTIVVIATLFLTACDNGTGGGNGAGGNVLSGNITITPNTNVTTGTLLSASYSGSENVTFQWKRGSENVETGTRFRPLRSGSLTVTVSASGYESKSANVTVTGEPANMFWWGNYIPENVMQLNQMGSAVFILNELVANVDNARKRYTLTGTINQQLVQHNNVIVNQDGTWDIFNSSGVWQTNETPRTLGALRWEENKSAESASKSSGLSITWNNQLGFYHIIHPKSFGSAHVTQAGTAINGIWTREDVIIDSFEYIVVRLINVRVSALDATHNITFPN